MPIVEQLDRAAGELATDHPINNRLALILIDNATELVLHRRCKTHALWDKEYRKLGKEKLSLKQRHMARGSYLEGKLIVLQALGEISENERRFIAICHDYRSEIYHLGLGHEAVIRAMAGRYFGLCCELFGRIRPDHVSWSSRDEMTEIGKRYLVKITGQTTSMLDLDVEKLAAALLAERPDMPDLSSTLGQSAADAIGEIEEAFEFFVNDNPAKLRADDALEQIQFHFDFLRRAEKEGIEGSNWDQEYQRRMFELRKEMQLTWRPRFRRIPFDNWRARATETAAERDALIALDRYQALRNDMAYLEEVIGEAAAELDAWIQLQIDIARGK
ncbi:MAG: hypothetical protein AB7S58_22940 [Dongiaceae bacterium]